MKKECVIVLLIPNRRNGMQMRWLVFFLIVLNGLVYVWFSYQQKYNYQPGVDENISQFEFASADKLTLLTELSSAELQQRDLRLLVSKVPDAPQTFAIEQPVDDGQDTETEALALPSCIIVGSYPEVISARQARIELAEAKVPARVVQIAKQLPAVSWVYIPPQASRKDALIILKSLQDKKIDSFLMSEPGEYQYAISLGFFGNADSARSIERERRAQGYDAQLAMRIRERKAYWLGIEDRQLLTQQSTLDAIENLLDEKRSIKKQEISCDELALIETIN